MLKVMRAVRGAGRVYRHVFFGGSKISMEIGLLCVGRVKTEVRGEAVSCEIDGHVKWDRDRRCERLEGEADDGILG